MDGGGSGVVWWRLVLTIISASLFVVVLVQCIDKVLRMRAPGLVTDGGVQVGMVACARR